jgi:hypothetical protein
MRRFTVLVLVLAVGLTVAAVPFASKRPDGLNRVALDHGFADHARGGSHYGYAAVGGTLLVFALGYGIARRRAR